LSWPVTFTFFFACLTIIKYTFCIK
jgi:hypothetical protein